MNLARLGIFGALAGVRDKQAARAQASDAAQEKRSLDDALLSYRNAQADEATAHATSLRNPKPAAPHYDESRGVLVGDDGRVTMPIGLPAKPAAPEPLEVVIGKGGQRTYEPRSKAVGQRAPEPGEPLVQTQDEQGNVIYTPRSSAAGMKAKTPGNSGAAAIQTKVAANETQLSVIDDALKELDAHEGAVGLKRGAGDLPFIGGTIGDPINQRADPEGIAARASIANIASLKVHDRSGGAVTISEYPRLAPFVPKISDTPKAIRIKLAKLRQAVKVETDYLRNSAEQGGAKAAKKPQADASMILKKYNLE